jgi:signal transduction histidine kinase
VFLVGYALGRRERRWMIGLGATALLAVSVLLQVHYDSQIKAGGLRFSFVLWAMVIALWLAGRLLRSRAALVADLAVRTEELRRQRDENAKLAVAAERDHIASELDRTVGEQLSHIISEVASSRRSALIEPERTRAVFTRIEEAARSALGQMRRTVGALLAEPAPTRPSPVLTELSRLVEARNGQMRLVVDGEPRQLGEGLELSGYRIVEGILGALRDGPSDGVEVTVRFTPEALEIGRRFPIPGPESAPAVFLACSAFSTVGVSRSVGVQSKMSQSAASRSMLTRWGGLVTSR